MKYDIAALKAELDRDALDARPRDMWRYREMLPVRRTENIVSLGEAETPLVALESTAAALGVDGQNLIVKDEGDCRQGLSRCAGW